MSLYAWHMGHIFKNYDGEGRETPFDWFALGV